MSATIERLMTTAREMTISEAAYVLGRSDDFMERAVKNSKIEARADEGRGTGMRTRCLISREALLVYIVRTTRGDRLTLMRAIEQLMPRACLDLAQSIVNPQPPPPQAPTKRRGNIIPIGLQQHPEFDFAGSTPPPAKATA